MKVSDYMRIETITASADMKASDVASQMVRSHVSGMPVVDKSNKVVGIITEGDLLRRAEIETEHHRPRWLQFLLGSSRLAEDYVKSHARTVKDIMSKDVAVIDSNAPLDDAVEMMERRGVKRLPVVNGGTLVGIISRADILAAFVYKARSEKKESASDGEIRQAIISEFEKNKWLHGDRLSIVVRNGEVDISGTVMSESERKAFVTLAESAAGVKKVHDHLIYVDPIALTPMI